MRPKTDGRHRSNGCPKFEPRLVFLLYASLSFGCGSETVQSVAVCEESRNCGSTTVCVRGACDAINRSIAIEMECLIRSKLSWARIQIKAILMAMDSVMGTKLTHDLQAGIGQRLTAMKMAYLMYSNPILPTGMMMAWLTPRIPVIRAIVQWSAARILRVIGLGEPCVVGEGECSGHRAHDLFGRRPRRRVCWRRE